MPPVDIKTMNTNQSALVLANAASLVSGVVQEIAGNDISSSINGSKITSSVVETLAHQRIVKRLEKKD